MAAMSGAESKQLLTGKSGEKMFALGVSKVREVLDLRCKFNSALSGTG